MAYGCHEERYPLPIAAVDTHRPKPFRNRKGSVVGSAVGSVAGADVAAGGEAMSRATTSRDYFGDTSHLQAAHATVVAAAGSVGEQVAKTPDGIGAPMSGSGLTETEMAVEAVKAALTRDADNDMLTPKAVAGQ